VNIDEQIEEYGIGITVSMVKTVSIERGELCISTLLYLLFYYNSGISAFNPAFMVYGLSLLFSFMIHQNSFCSLQK